MNEEEICAQAEALMGAAAAAAVAAGGGTGATNAAARSHAAPPASSGAAAGGAAAETAPTAIASSAAAGEARGVTAVCGVVVARVQQQRPDRSAEAASTAARDAEPSLAASSHSCERFPRDFSAACVASEDRIAVAAAPTASSDAPDDATTAAKRSAASESSNVPPPPLPAMPNQHSPNASAPQPAAACSPSGAAAGGVNADAAPAALPAGAYGGIAKILSFGMQPQQQPRQLQPGQRNAVEPHPYQQPCVAGGAMLLRMVAGVADGGATCGAASEVPMRAASTGAAFAAPAKRPAASPGVASSTWVDAQACGVRSSSVLALAGQASGQASRPPPPPPQWPSGAFTFWSLPQPHVFTGSPANTATGMAAAEQPPPEPRSSSSIAAAATAHLAQLALRADSTADDEAAAGRMPHAAQAPWAALPPQWPPRPPSNGCELAAAAGGMWASGATPHSGAAAAHDKPHAEQHADHAAAAALHHQSLQQEPCPAPPGGPALISGSSMSALDELLGQLDAMETDALDVLMLADTHGVHAAQQETAAASSRVPAAGAHPRPWHAAHVVHVGTAPAQLLTSDARHDSTDSGSPFVTTHHGAGGLCVDAAPLAFPGGALGRATATIRTGGSAGLMWNPSGPAHPHLQQLPRAHHLTWHGGSSFAAPAGGVLGATPGSAGLLYTSAAVTASSSEACTPDPASSTGGHHTTSTTAHDQQSGAFAGFLSVQQLGGSAGGATGSGVYSSGGDCVDLYSALAAARCGMPADAAAAANVAALSTVTAAGGVRIGAAPARGPGLGSFSSLRMPAATDAGSTLGIGDVEIQEVMAGLMGTAGPPVAPSLRSGGGFAFL
ncbi:hypothetical protein HXX76_007947 [Chlamydomonas incerta]|uniref:Uncharacterized protein n=1 Tax=Chlamydomonas incerta TaxID=51695 RepID=A0A835SYT5_CHLIN|nr:hypothetical protein HXX76_007947 [Chlamydomonas incerta]|eukprot:KAG2434221.1 hypothetical protein HXX76_007947 [Chlamydomonas incerta]